MNVRVRAVKHFRNGYPKVDIGFHAAATTVLCVERGGEGYLSLTNEAQIQQDIPGGMWYGMALPGDHGSCNKATNGKHICQPEKMSDQSSFKYILTLDGYVTPWRLTLELDYGSLLFMVHSGYKSWFYDILLPCTLNYEDVFEATTAEDAIDRYRHRRTRCITSWLERDYAAGTEAVYAAIPVLVGVPQTTPEEIARGDLTDMAKVEYMLDWFRAEEVDHDVAAGRQELARKMASNSKIFRQAIINEPSIRADWAYLLNARAQFVGGSGYQETSTAGFERLLELAPRALRDPIPDEEEADRDIEDEELALRDLDKELWGDQREFGVMRPSIFDFITSAPSGRQVRPGFIQKNCFIDTYKRHDGTEEMPALLACEA